MPGCDTATTIVPIALGFDCGKHSREAARGVRGAGGEGEGSRTPLALSTVNILELPVLLFVLSLRWSHT